MFFVMTGKFSVSNSPFDKQLTHYTHKTPVIPKIFSVPLVRILEIYSPSKKSIG